MKRCADVTFGMAGSTLAVLYLLGDREALFLQGLHVELQTLPWRRSNGDLWVGLQLQNSSLVEWIVVTFGEDEVSDDLVVTWWIHSSPKPPKVAEPPDGALSEIFSRDRLAEVPERIYQMLSDYCEWGVH